MIRANYRLLKAKNAGRPLTSKPLWGKLSASNFSTNPNDPQYRQVKKEQNLSAISVFFSRSHRVDFTKKSDDEEVVVDVEKLNLWEYFKYLYHPQTKLEDKDFFPYMTSLFLLLFGSHLLIKNILFYIYIDEKDYQMVSEVNKEVKMANVNGKTVYEVNVLGVFNYDKFQQDLCRLKKEYDYIVNE